MFPKTSPIPSFGGSQEGVGQDEFSAHGSKPRCGMFLILILGASNMFGANPVGAN